MRLWRQFEAGFSLKQKHHPHSISVHLAKRLTSSLTISGLGRDQLSIGISKCTVMSASHPLREMVLVESFTKITLRFSERRECCLSTLAVGRPNNSFKPKPPRGST